MYSVRRSGGIFRQGNQFPFRVTEFNTVVNFSKVLRSFCYSSTERSLSRQESRQENSAGEFLQLTCSSGEGPVGAYVLTVMKRVWMHRAQHNDCGTAFSTPRARERGGKNIFSYLWKEEQYFSLSTLHLVSYLPKPNYIQKRQLRVSRI